MYHKIYCFDCKAEKECKVIESATSFFYDSDFNTSYQFLFFECDQGHVTPYHHYHCDKE